MQVARLAALAVCALAACTTELSTERPADRAVPSAQALHSGTCASSCGDVSPDGCWCDDACEEWGDCCPDFEAQCVIDDDLPPGACEDASDCAEGEECRQVQCVTTPCYAMCTPVCAEALMLCAPGTLPEDTDGDGCKDACVPACEIAIRCAAGYHPEDADGDGCPDTCTPDAACTVSLLCVEGSLAQDTDGDGCEDACVPTEPAPEACVDDADCPNGYCESFASCLAIGCPPPPPNQCVVPDCGDGSELVCRMLPLDCGPGMNAAVIQGCWQCVDARTCQPRAPAADSCQDRCGGQAPDGCWCDEGCAWFGDCCADATDVCGF